MANIAVIGGGAWGTALGASLSSQGSEVMLYAREKEAVDSINNSNINKPFLDGIKLPATLRASDNIADIIRARIILITTPSQFFRASLQELSKHEIDEETVFLICSKGIENNSYALMSHIFEETLSNDYAILSGPTFAHEVATGVATSLSLASHDITVAERVKRVIQKDNFHCHLNNDVIGSQICGAMKNVIAIGCGMVRGMKQGENTHAAIMTQGFHEIMDVNIAMGGKMQTLLEPCGIGDLVLTCSSEKSRNFSFGMAMAQEKDKKELLGSTNKVVEGVATAKSVANLARHLRVNLPLCEKINEVIEGKAEAKEILTLV